MELAFPLGSMVAALGGGALVLCGVDLWWTSRRVDPSPLAAAAWQWSLVFVTAVAALMLGHVTAFGLTVPGVTRVIGELGVVWGSERWSDAIAFALDPVAAALLAGPVLLVAVTAFVDTARASPTPQHRVRSAAMSLALAGLCCVAMARSSGGLLAGWITVGAASLLATSTTVSSVSRTSHAATLDPKATAWLGLARREVVACVAVALAGAHIAWVMPSWAFDPVALAVVPGDDSLLRQAGPFGAPVAESLTVVIVTAALLRLSWWATTSHGGSGATLASGAHAAAMSSSSPDGDAPAATLDTIAIIRDVSAIAVIVRHDVVVALAPLPLGILGVIAVVGALVASLRLIRPSSTMHGGSSDLDFRPASSAVALLAVASFVPELAIAVTVIAGATWWMVRRVPFDQSRMDVLLRWLVAPIPVGLGLALAATALATWVNVSAFSPLFNVIAAGACLVVGLALAVSAASMSRTGAGEAPGGIEEPSSREARRAGQVLVALVIPLASLLVLPMQGGSLLSRAFMAHVAIPRGLAGVYAVGPSRGWGDASIATWSAFASIVLVLLVASVWARWRGRTSTASPLLPDRSAPAPATTGLRRVTAWLDAAPERGLTGLGNLLRGLGRAFEFGVGRVALRDFVALASDELDRASLVSGARHRLRAALGLVVVLALVLGAIFANRGASSFAPDALHGFPGLRARLGGKDDTSLQTATNPGDEMPERAGRGGR